MGFELRDALRHFCVEIGWSYAVFWRAIGFPNPKHLVWGDGHWSGKLQLPRSDDVNSHVCSSAEFHSLGGERIDELVNKTMVPQVHFIGVGIVGQTAFTGNHCWILRNVTGDHESSLKDFPDVNNQFLAGIQTIVIIPVFPLGVVQFGSTKRVMENVQFVNHARTSLMQLALESGSSILGSNSFPPPYIGSAISDYQLRDNCNNVDRSLSMRCNHQLSISSATRSSSRRSSSLSVQVKEKMSKFDAERLSNKGNVGVASLSPFAELHQPTIDQAGNILFHFNKQLENELLDAQLTSNEDLMSLSEMPVTSGNLSLMEHNILPPCGSGNQQPDGRFGDFDIENQLRKVEPMDRAKDMERLTSARASEIVSTHSNVSCANRPGEIQDINSLNGNHSISVHSYTNNLSKKTQGVSMPGYLKQENNGLHSSGISSSSCGLPLIGLEECWFGGSSIFEANQEIEIADCHGEDNCKVQKLKKICAENDSSFISIPNEKSSSFSQLTTSGDDDLFDVLGHYNSLDGVKASRKQLTADVPSCSTQLNPSPLLFSVEDAISCTGVFSESKSDQLLDAVVSSVYRCARRSSDETPSLKTSEKKVNGSSIPCPSLSNDGSTSSGQKQGDYMLSSLVKGNAEGACSTSMRTADRIERPRFDKSQTSLWIESGKNMNGDNLFASRGKRVDEIGKFNRKRARPGETPRPRPKDRQLIMDRVRELREIVPNGVKCSIDALLEKTIKHMLFLQSVSKHADKLKRTGEPKIISKDGAVVLKDNLRGGATWAFEVGSQTMTCPIIVEDLNPPREMLVEMLCEERGLFLEIADLIRGLGLTILKGVMEARRDKIWARFAVEANRDVTRMEIFLCLVHLLEPTIGSGKAPHSAHNKSKTPEKISNLHCVPATGMVSDPLQY